MDSRRVPFQFSATDPAKRHEELRKRFGFSALKKDMLLESMDSSAMDGSHSNSSSATNSPQLQHRRPILGQSTEMCVDSLDKDNKVKKPHVRVIPIEVEGESVVFKENDSFHSSFPKINASVQNSLNKRNTSSKYSPKSYKSLSKEPTVKPIAKMESSVKTKNERKKDVVPESNSMTLKKQTLHEKESKLKKPVLSLPHKQIENILKGFQEYEVQVTDFQGTVKDKQYRYLDEMLTRCLLELDNVETLGREDIRLFRKSAIKKVQSCADLLEKKVNKGQKINLSDTRQTVDNNVELNDNIVSNKPNMEYQNQLQKQLVNKENETIKMDDSKEKLELYDSFCHSTKSDGCRIEEKCGERILEDFDERNSMNVDEIISTPNSASDAISSNENPKNVETNYNTALKNDSDELSVIDNTNGEHVEMDKAMWKCNQRNCI